MRTRILFSHKLLLFCIVTLSHLFSGVCFNVADAVSTGTVDFRGSEVSSNIPAGAHYQHDGNRKVSNNVEVTPEGDSRRVVLEEKWKKPLGKAPDITIFTLKVTAKGQGRILLTLNRDSGGPTSNRDVGGYRGRVDPYSLDNDEDFFLEHHVRHENIRSYEDGFDSPYDDECVPVKHKGYNLEVVTGEEDLDAVGKVFAEKVSIAYGRERSTQQALGLTGGWDSAAIEANFVHGTKRTWGWKLIAHTENYTGDSIDSSFRVTVNDIVTIRDGNKQDPACVECENCGEFVHHKDDHFLGLCPLDPNVKGCGEKRWSCETSKQLAWHQVRDCYNSVTLPLPLVGGPTEFCPKKFRHCKNPSCDFRIKGERGHSDGTQSNPPSGVANLTAESHLIDDPPSTSTATLTSSDGSNTATAGSSFTVNVSVSSGWTSIYWYMKSPSQSGIGTSVSNVSDSTGNSTTGSYTYSFPSGASGDYVLTAYITLSDFTIVQPSCTVSVSSGGTSGGGTSDGGTDDTGGTDDGEQEIYKVCTRWKWKLVWNSETQRYDSVYEQCGESFTDEFNYVGLCESHAAYEE